MNWQLTLGILASLFLHIIDQGTDIFAAVLFYFEGYHAQSFITIGLVFLPGFCIYISELRRSFCTKPCVSLPKAIGYLLFSPLWAIVIHIYSLCDERYVKSALYFKTLQGFVEAGPQFALQLSLLIRGGWGPSSRAVLEPFIPVTLPPMNTTFIGEDTGDENLETTTVLPEFLEESKYNGSLVIFDRVYDEDARYYFGCIHIASVILSFVSIWTSSVIFNDVEDAQSFQEGEKCCSSKLVGKIIFGAPYLLATLIYRAVGMALLMCFLELWSGLIIFGIFFINILSAMSIGDDFNRGFSYALWSMFVPVGYSRDPSSHLGYTKVPLGELFPETSPTDKDIERSRQRGKHFLTIHVLTSIFILGSSLIAMLIIVFTNFETMQSKVVFPLEYLTYLFLPLLGLSLAISILLVRPYHRCDCSGGEIPSGNVIV